MANELAGLESKETLEQFLQELLHNEVAASIMMIDIDDFKLINDRHSHLIGDEILQGVATTIHRLVTRYQSGRAFRFGGDEICVVLPEHDVREASALAERMRAEISACRFPSLLHPVSTTVGVAGPPSSAASNVLNHADVALQEGKRNGKGRVAVFDPLLQHHEQYRVVLNPRLYDAIGKSLRLVFVPTGSYHRAGKELPRRIDAPVKCVSVLGQYDLLFIHLGDTDRRFLAEVQPLIIDSGADPLVATYPPFFVATRIHKFHGLGIPDVSVVTPPSETLRLLADAAHGLVLPQEHAQEWRDNHYILGIESRQLRAGLIEAYMLVGLSLASPEGHATDILVHKLLRDFIVPDKRVFSIYEGYGSVRTVQFVIRTRSTPSELFAFIEDLHARCDTFALAAHTNTYIVVDEKLFRLYDNLN